MQVFWDLVQQLFLGESIDFKMYFHDWLWVARQHNINNCVLAFYAIKIPLHISTPSTKLDCFQNSKVWVFIAQPLQGRTMYVLISKTEMRILLWKCFNHYCVHYCFKEVECKKINKVCILINYSFSYILRLWFWSTLLGLWNR